MNGRRASASVSLFLLLLTTCSTSNGYQSATAYLDTALGGLRWIESQAVETGSGGLLFPNVPGEPESPTADLSIYHGQPGRVLGFLQAYAATGVPRWRELAESSLAAMTETADALLAREYRDAGLYTGLAGIASVELLAAQVLDSADSRQRALAHADQILESAIEAEGGHHWNGVVDIISGAAGTGLFLLKMYEDSGDERYREAAERAARWLIATARPDAESWGVYWSIAPGDDRHYPNFSHGTAGVAFFLGRIAAIGGSVSDQARSFRDNGLIWLQAHGEADGCVVFHHESGGEDLQYASWCHGPAGTSRLFFQIHAARDPGDPPAIEAAVAGAEYLIGLGPEPGESPEGYWGNTGVCCGTAGLLNFMIDLYLFTGDERYRAAARSYGDVLVREAIEENGGLKWPMAEHRVRPDFVQSQTGWMQGAAGVAASLIRLHLLETDRPDLILRLPDEITP
jgi:lantibiotic modifying enzyme